MASLRRKYQLETKDGPPVTTASSQGARLPEPAADAPKPAELEPQSPADAAASSAIKDRLAEMERAEQFAKQPPPPQQRAAEPPQQQPEMPAPVAKFLAENPQYTDPNDAIAQAEIYTATLKCNRDGKTWDQSDFIPTLERHLGLRPATNGHVESRPTPQPNYAPARSPAPSRQQVRPMAAPVSAPPTREAPSMATGRAPTHRAPLTRDELEIAAASGMTAEQYQQQKERMLRMKAAGEMQ
jgi:hypothetical protein